MDIRSLSEIVGRSEAVAGTGKPMNVCIVSSGFLGPVKNGGIGTATSGLARQLVSDGHNVTILYTYVGDGKPVSGDKPWQYWVRQLAGEGIVLEHIPLNDDFRAWKQASWLVKEFVGQKNFEVVYFDDHFGSGYYSMLAKRAGMKPFCSQLHCLITHGSIEWIFNINDYYASRPSDIEWMGLERRSVEMADVVIAPSAYLLREYESYGWRLPVRTFHQPYPIFRRPTVLDRGQRIPITELVFFGRLEVRKGLWIFCEALDRLADQFPRIDVTFMGRVTEFSGISSALQIVNRTSRWPFRVRLLTNFDQDEALAYLKKPGRLAVMPSVADNSPCAVYECMEAGIPFVSTRGSGVDELVHPSCWDEMLIEPNVKSLTAKLREILERGAQLGEPGFDPVQNLASWSAWHRLLSVNRKFLDHATGDDRQATTNGDSAGQAALIVVVDNGDCALSVLVDNLNTHVRRYGQRAAYLVLSSRHGELQEIILEMVGSGSSEALVCILDSRAAREASDLIRQSSFVFFADAETEILETFFASALDRMRRQHRGIVSCVVATRRGKDGVPEIYDLPLGSIPGAGALGERLAGSVFAITAAALAGELAQLEIYDAQLDAFISPSLLGQLLILNCRKHSIPFDLFPLVGAITTVEREEFAKHWTFGDIRRIGEHLGVAPSVYKGGPPWFAISSCGAHLDTRNIVAVDGTECLPSNHPAASVELQTGSPDVAEKDLPVLAASLGRLDLALQIDTDNGSASGRRQYLTGLAGRSTRLRPVFDLVDLMKGRKVCGSQASSSALLGHIYADRRQLEISGNELRMGPDSSGKAAKLVMFDVPLCGRSSLSVKFHARPCSDLAIFNLRIIEQRSGGELGAASARLSGDSQGEFAIPLYELYVRAAIIFEFAETKDLSIRFDEIKIH